MRTENSLAVVQVCTATSLDPMRSSKSFQKSEGLARRPPQAALRAVAGNPHLPERPVAVIHGGGVKWTRDRHWLIRPWHAVAPVLPRTNLVYIHSPELTWKPI